MPRSAAINIEGIDKAKLLAALYNASHPQGMGFLHYDPEPMGEDEAREILKTYTYFDYLKGRVLKVDLSSDVELFADLYDRDNGPGAAEYVVEELRETGGTNSKRIQSMHGVETAFAALDAGRLADSKSEFSKEGNLAAVTLGADELGPELKAKARKAFEEVTKHIKTGEQDDATK